MKRLLGFIAIFFLSQIAIAGDNQELSVKINLDMQHNQERFALHNNIKLDAKNHHWIILGGSQSKKNKIILLAQVENSDSKKAKLRFLILDNSETPVIISQPEIITEYNKQSKLVLKGNEDELRLNIIAMK